MNLFGAKMYYIWMDDKYIHQQGINNETPKC